MQKSIIFLATSMKNIKLKKQFHLQLHQKRKALRCIFIKRSWKLIIWKLQKNGLKKINKILIGNLSCSWIRNLKNFKIVILPELFYRFKIIPIKIQPDFFVKAVKLTLNFIWKLIGPRISKISWKRTKLRTQTSQFQNLLQSNKWY